MKTLLLTLSIAAATLMAPATSQAREHHDHDRGDLRHRFPHYVDPHKPGFPPRLNRFGHLIDSRGHRVNAWGRHVH